MLNHLRTYARIFLNWLNLKGVILNKKQKAWKAAIARLDKNDIVMLETGRIRNPKWSFSDGNSTWFFTRWKSIRKLYSIDNDSENFTGRSTSEDYCRHYLSEAQLQRVVFINGDSRSEIPKLRDTLSFDVVLLDSANDASLILEECKAVLPLLNRPGLLIIDDVNGQGVKGRLAIPYLESFGLHCEYYEAPPCDGCWFLLR